MRPLKSSFPKLPFRDDLCGWCLLVGGCQLFRAWVPIKGIKERQGAILRDSLLGGWVFIFSDFHWRREGGGTEFCCKNMMRNPQLPSPNSPLFYLFIYLFMFSVIRYIVVSFKYYICWFLVQNYTHWHLFMFICLRADVSYFLCCTRKRDVCVTPSLIVFQRPAGFPRSWEHAVIGWHTVRIVWLNADWLLSKVVW